MKNKIKIQKGFTLIELMAVVAILGILLMIGIPSYKDYMMRGKMLDVVVGCQTPLKSNAAMFYQQYGFFPFAASGSSVATLDAENAAIRPIYDGCNEVKYVGGGSYPTISTTSGYSTTPGVPGAPVSTGSMYSVGTGVVGNSNAPYVKLAVDLFTSRGRPSGAEKVIISKKMQDDGYGDINFVVVANLPTRGTQVSSFSSYCGYQADEILSTSETTNIPKEYLPSSCR